MTAFLVDANVAIALVVGEHEHHERANTWLAGVDAFAFCPIVEGALVRFLLRLGHSGGTTSTVLTELTQHAKAQFWPDSLTYADVPLGDVRGHRQVTDVYLAALAGVHEARLATFDVALTELRPEQTFLIP